jgi:hypothetical protein
VTSAPGRPVCADAAWTHHASLVVEHGDGRVVRVCVGFDGSTLTGDQLLAASRVEFATAGSASMGKAVCQIDAEPASYPPTCWTTTSPYWVVFVSRHDGPWSFSNLGVSSQTFADGDAEGFRYDPQAGPAAAPPSPSGTCVLPASPTPAPVRPGVTATPRRATSSTNATPPPSAGTPAAATASPSPGVVSARTSGPSSRPVSAAGFSVAPVVAAAAGGGLIGLLILRALRLRRR